jgi:hypothetical protein
MESPLIFAPTENDPAFVPEAAAPPLIVNHAADEVAVQVSVPEPLFVTATVWLDGFAPPWIAENDMDVGFLAIVGVEGVVDVVEGADGDVGVSNPVRPGMDVDSLFIPRPPSELPPLLDDPGAATAEMGAELDESEVVGLETPANERDVAGAVVVVEVGFVGATAVVGVEFWTVESLL